MKRLPSKSMALVILMLAATCSCSAIVPAIIDLFPADPIDRLLQDAHDAEGREQYGLAEEKYLSIIQEYSKEKIEVAWPYEALYKIYEIQGRYQDAIAATEASSRIDKIDHGTGRTQLARGKFQEALDIYLRLIKLHFRVKDEPNHSDAVIYLYDYPVLADCYICLGEYEEARPYLEKNLEYEEKRPAHSRDKALARFRLASTYFYAGDYIEAEKVLREAAGMGSIGFGASTEEVALMLTMLGQTQDRLGKGDQARATFNTALANLRGSSPEFDQLNQADVLIEIGRFQIEHGKPVEARAAYSEAVRLRTVTDTQTHPNCADAIKGLADVSVAEDQLTSATIYANRALKILDTALVPTHPRIAPALIAVGSIDILAGNPDAVAPLDARIETILQKPLGPWKEDYMDTAAFYADALRKKGKIAEAERLDQLRARQKDKR